jgi:hypothetical protein
MQSCKGPDLNTFWKRDHPIVVITTNDIDCQASRYSRSKSAKTHETKESDS